MDTAAIRKKLYEYIRHADDKKVRAIYTIVENDIDQVNEWWQNEKLVSELEQHSADLRSGRDAGIVWSDLKKVLTK
jgi:hypothetical protein